MEGNYHASRVWKGDIFWIKRPTSNTDVGFFYFSSSFQTRASKVREGGWIQENKRVLLVKRFYLIKGERDEK